MVTVNCNVQATDEIMAKQKAGLKALNEKTVAKRIIKTIAPPLAHNDHEIHAILCDEMECDKIATVYCTHCTELHCPDHIIEDCILRDVKDVAIDWDLRPVVGPVPKGYELFAKWSGMEKSNPEPVVCLEPADEHSTFIKVLTKIYFIFK